MFYDEVQCIGPMCNNITLCYLSPCVHQSISISIHPHTPPIHPPIMPPSIHLIINSLVCKKHVIIHLSSWIRSYIVTQYRLIMNAWSIRDCLDLLDNEHSLGATDKGQPTGGTWSREVLHQLLPVDSLFPRRPGLPLLSTTSHLETPEQKVWHHHQPRDGRWNGMSTQGRSRQRRKDHEVPSVVLKPCNIF